MYSATYSPQDNKLRLYSSERLDSETYASLKAAGFIWAPKQECFVAPMWTPGREDILLSLVDCIEDEDSTTEERAAQRAERFQGYSVKRAADAERAYESVQAIAEAIPFGQPILVGHHSQRKAEKDAQRIENGMRKTIKLWETSEYWTDRAKASIRHARFKEQPGVRHRRIKGLEADARKYQRELDLQEQRRAYFSRPELTKAEFLKAFNVGTFGLYDGREVYAKWTDDHYEIVGTLAEATERLLNNSQRVTVHYQRWLDHTNNRITYEKAMLGDWEPPKKERVKRELSPLVNFRVDGCIEMTSAEWKRSSKCSDAYQCVPMNADGSRAAWRTSGHYRQRHLCSMMGKDKPVFITDMPVKMPPAVEVSADAG